ncbi:MAG TPA: GDSL-type esterase/lipase family protein [Candidatus Binatia bacterium]|nr:GDSL-type esterase/lipase family protein [Candidatus Binatia bacterium]
MSAPDPGAGRQRVAVRAREVLGRAAIALAAVAFVLVTGEIAARIAGLETPAYFGTGGESCIARSAALGVELRPRCTGSVAGTAFRTNALGLRGADVPDDATLRILALGDSCTWGYRVAEEETYPAVLQRLLDERAGARRYQVLNAGVPGWTSHQGLLYLEHNVTVLRPALVIAGFAFNDGFRMGDVEEELARARRLLPVLRVDDVLLDRSLLYRWTRLRLAGPLRATGVRRVAPEKYRANLERLVSVARDHGAHAALVDWNLGYLREYRDVARAVGAERAVPLVVYEGARVDAVHPTAAGYAALARRLLDTLAETGALPLRAPPSP